MRGRRTRTPTAGIIRKLFTVVGIPIALSDISGSRSPMTYGVAMSAARKGVIEDALRPMDPGTAHSVFVIESRGNTVGKKGDHAGRVLIVSAYEMSQMFGLFLL